MKQVLMYELWILQPHYSDDIEWGVIAELPDRGEALAKADMYERRSFPVEVVEVATDNKETERLGELRKTIYKGGE